LKTAVRSRFAAIPHIDPVSSVCVTANGSAGARTDQHEPSHVASPTALVASMERLVIIDRVPQDIHCYASPSDTLRHALFEGKQRLSRKFDPLIKIDCRNDAKTNELLASEVMGCLPSLSGCWLLLRAEPAASLDVYPAKSRTGVRGFMVLTSLEGACRVLSPR